MKYFPATAPNVCEGWSRHAAAAPHDRILRPISGPDQPRSDLVWCEAEGQLIDLAADRRTSVGRPEFKQRETPWPVRPSPAMSAANHLPTVVRSMDALVRIPT